MDQRLPAEYQDIVTATATQESERLKSLSKQTGLNYSDLLIEYKLLI